MGFPTGEIFRCRRQTYRNLLAFSVGRRNCIGEAMANSTMFLYLATILQSYDIVVGSDGIFPDINPRNYLPGGDLRVKDYMCRAYKRK